MKARTLLALLVILGACKADHTLGSVGLDSGADQMNADTGAPTYADAQISASPETGGTAEVPPNGGLDAGASGTLGPVQSWTGWVENYQFPSGSDVIKFSFASDSAGQVVGQVIFGTGSPPPPPTDPNVGYLWDPSPGTVPLPPIYDLMEGFPYSMFAGSLTSTRLRFTIHPFEPWAGGCALQTSMAGSQYCVLHVGGTCDIVDGGGNSVQCSLIDPRDGGSVAVTVDYGKMVLCQTPLCLCSPTGCAVDYSAPNDRFSTSFDVALSGGTASGSMKGRIDSNVHFTKDP